MWAKYRLTRAPFWGCSPIKITSTRIDDYVPGFAWGRTEHKLDWSDIDAWRGVLPGEILDAIIVHEIYEAVVTQKVGGFSDYKSAHEAAVAVENRLLAGKWTRLTSDPSLSYTDYKNLKTGKIWRFALEPGLYLGVHKFSWTCLGK